MQVRGRRVKDESEASQWQEGRVRDRRGKPWAREARADKAKLKRKGISLDNLDVMQNIYFSSNGVIQVIVFM